MKSKTFLPTSRPRYYPPGCDFELLEKVVDGNIGYLVWHAESEDYKIPFASDTFVFEDEKILVQTVAFILHKKQ